MFAATQSSMTHRVGCAVSVRHTIVTGHNYAIGGTSYHAEQAALESALRSIGRLQAFRHCRKQRRLEGSRLREVGACSRSRSN
jgi:hypothetical protein